MRSIKSFLIYGLISVILVSCGPSRKGSEAGWIYLYNGKDLSGWIQRNGEAPFEAVDSMIVGTTVFNTPNSFLCTEKDYGDFILEFDFLVDPSMNSGVQIRSLSTPEYMNGRVHGYQVEIDPSPRAFTGGIYDEARQGWLYTLSDENQESARNAFVNGQWNKIRVEAIGNHIKTWVNGVPVTNLYDETTLSGFIALQVHEIYDSTMLGKQIAWKNIRIMTGNLENNLMDTDAPEKAYLVNKLTEKEKAEGWQLLFDGQTSNGWRKFGTDEFPSKGYEIKDGELNILINKDFDFDADRVIGGDIITEDEYSDFDLQLQVKLNPEVNTGVKYFVKEKSDSKPGAGVGLEYQIIDASRIPFAERNKQKDILLFGSLYNLIPAEGLRINPVGQWNNVRILSKNNHVEHWLNGFKVLEFERGSKDFRDRVAKSKFAVIPGFGEEKSGHILLQDHGGGASYRSIKIKKLN